MYVVASGLSSYATGHLSVSGWWGEWVQGFLARVLSIVRVRCSRQIQYRCHNSCSYSVTIIGELKTALCVCCKCYSQGQEWSTWGVIRLSTSWLGSSAIDSEPSQNPPTHNFQSDERTPAMPASSSPSASPESFRGLDSCKTNNMRVQSVLLWLIHWCIVPR